MMKALIVCMLMLVVCTAKAEPLGRLFSSPNERQALDHMRKNKKEMVPTPITKKVVPVIVRPKEIAEPVVLPETIAIQGYVKRTDGKKSTVWVNGEAIQENTSNDDIAVGRLSSRDNRVPVRVKANGKRLGLKAGQAYYPESNRIREVSTVQE